MKIIKSNKNLKVKIIQLVLEHLLKMQKKFCKQDKVNMILKN